MPESDAAAAKRTMRDQCPHGCGRRVTQDFRQRADGQKAQSKRASFAPQLPDDFCRYCSRALTEAAKALEEAAARPRTRDDVIGALNFKSADTKVRV